MTCDGRGSPDLAQGALDQPLFSIWLAANEGRDVTGEATFGAINSRYFNGPLNQIPVNSKVRRMPIDIIIAGPVNPDDL